MLSDVYFDSCIEAEGELRDFVFCPSLSLTRYWNMTFFDILPTNTCLVNVIIGHASSRVVIARFEFTQRKTLVELGENWRTVLSGGVNR